MNKNETKLLNEARTFSRRDALQVFGGAGLGAFFTGLVNPVSIVGQTKQSVVNSARKEDLQGAGFYRFKIGAFECAVVSDGVLQLKPSEFFINPPAEVENALREMFLPTDKITLQINTLVVRNGKTIALFDTGIGNYIGENGGRLPAHLERAGVNAADITDVFLSHAHFDHIGGNTDAQNRLNFPNASFHLSQTEWTAATGGEKPFFGEAKSDEATKKLLLDAIRKNLAPFKDRVKMFQTDAEILPGIKAVTAFGHTPGHSTFLIESNGESLIYVGDLIHHLIQLTAPQIQMNGNSFQRQSADSRRKLLKNIADQKMKMMAAHFPFPGIGHLRPRDEKLPSYEWIPIEWQW